MQNFTRVAPELAAALDNRGYKTLTPVQEAVLTEEMIGRDALVSAQTGSGKTLAFGLSISSDILHENKDTESIKLPRVLIIAPTRELALQVKRELEWLYAKTSVSIASCVGGMDMRTERRSLDRGPDIVIGTPGRLKDHIERRSLNLTGLKVVVLDEADEMLNLGFREELEFILSSTPKERRTILFSATISKGIAKLAERYQNDALRISTINENKQHLDIQYRAITVAARDNEHAIMNVLRYYDANNALVFCGTRATVNHLTSRLNNRGFSVVSLSGELSQKERTHALQSMRDGRSKVCVATDVAARGIDLPNLELVIHADLPKNKESLLHRSGRTGRAGKKGVSVLIVPPTSQRKVERLLDNVQIKAVWERPPKPEEILKRDNERILQDPIFLKTPTDEEKDFIALILEKHSAEEITGALVRKFRTEKFAPDEIQGVDEIPAKNMKRDDFKNGVWFKLSVGSDQKAEPRWLLPTIIGVSKINKKDIGSIKIQKEETFVEINPKALDKFMKSLGKNNTLEPGLIATLLDHAPTLSSRDKSSSQTEKSKERRKSPGAKEFDHANAISHEDKSSPQAENSKERRKLRRAKERQSTVNRQNPEIEKKSEGFSEKYQSTNSQDGANQPIRVSENKKPSHVNDESKQTRKPRQSKERQSIIGTKISKKPKKNSGRLTGQHEKKQELNLNNGTKRKKIKNRSTSLKLKI